MRFRKFFCTVILTAGMASQAQAFQFRLVGDRLWLKADQTPLHDVLMAFARSGVRVQVDPRIDATVTGKLSNEDVEAALGKLLESYGYVLFWDVMKGPLGSFPKLDEIKVFLPGNEEGVRPLQGVSDNLETATGPTGGPVFVRDEILLGVKAGSRLDDLKLLLDQIGGTLVGGLSEIGVYQVRLPPGTNIPDLVAQLSRNPLVAHVEPNYVTRVPSAQRQQGAAGNSAAGQVSVASPGKDAAAVAILDSGLLPVSGLDDAVIARFDALNPSRALGDSVGHGTQMAMIAAGAVDPGGLSGEAGESVPVVAIRAFDDNGNASYYGLMSSIDYAVQQKARVINLSWGSDTDSAFLSAAVAYAQAKGLIVVAAAGNEATGKAVYPAAYPGVVAVAALGADGNTWKNSNYGNFVTLAAPGLASFPVGHNGPPGSYAGTSISSAYTARALSLYLSQHPGATGPQAIKALEQALTDRGTKGRDATFGFGALDQSALGRLLQK
ncbi:MAG: S8 family serine peptidase [Lentisphaerota bacterium]